MDNRYDFLGVKISVINLDLAEQIICDKRDTEANYICFPDASVVAEANKNNKLMSILNNAYLTMPDGKPSQLAAKWQGHKEVTTVSGFHLCKRLLKTNLTHYFYGGTDELLKQLKEQLENAYPNAHILGYQSPPFLPLEEIESSFEIKLHMEEINNLKPDLVWIGISSPKQDFLMHHFHGMLSQSMMIGVGGVFLYLADESLKSPEWVKKMGFRWLYRLFKEPKRLWPKYYSTIRFLFSHSGYLIKLMFRKNNA